MVNRKLLKSEFFGDCVGCERFDNSDNLDEAIDKIVEGLNGDHKEVVLTGSSHCAMEYGQTVLMARKEGLRVYLPGEEFKESVDKPLLRIDVRGYCENYCMV